MGIVINFYGNRLIDHVGEILVAEIDIFRGRRRWNIKCCDSLLVSVCRSLWSHISSNKVLIFHFVTGDVAVEVLWMHFF